jgi:hypothetical protein
MARDPSGQLLMQFFESKGFKRCDGDVLVVHMSRDCDNSLWPDSVTIHHNSPRLGRGLCAYLITKVGLDPQEFFDSL